MLLVETVLPTKVIVDSGLEARRSKLLSILVEAFFTAYND
jgi:hypothetical protein